MKNMSELVSLNCLNYFLLRIRLQFCDGIDIVSRRIIFVAQGFFYRAS